MWYEVIIFKEEEMENKKEHNFNEKTEEFINGENLKVWLSPKYAETKKKVIEMIDSNKYGLTDNDFWILMNKTSKGDKMAYTGLIISHNGCLKINDALDDKIKFKPSCVKENQNGYEGSLVFTYCNDEQGIYEVGEINASNYKQKNGRYPYAMAYKRLFDRVVLKNSKLAYAGVYSDSEADEFKEPINEKEEIMKTPISEGRLQEIKDLIVETKTNTEKFLNYYNLKSLEEINQDNVLKIERSLIEKKKLLENKTLNKMEEIINE
jgi:hypothetical protein